MVISLCGFMGAGKSTIGKYLSKMLGYHFIDLDVYIEQKQQMSVAEFFAANGEPAFRKLELECLKEILDLYISEPENFNSGKAGSKNLILSLGGGTVTQEACARLVKENTHCIYLYCSKEELVKRLKRNIAKRPVLQGKTDKDLEAHVENLMQQRETIYKSCAHTTVDTGCGNLQDVINEILNTI